MYTSARKGTERGPTDDTVERATRELLGTERGDERDRCPLRGAAQ